ncbi:MAG TPA: glycosyltransferase family 39 protein [Galbitalea sp.]
MIDTSVQQLVGLPKGVRVHSRAVGEKAPVPVPPARSRGWVDPLWVGALATLVSAIGSWIPSKWNDEAATQTAALRTLPHLWQMMQNIDAVHGAYYFLMHFWILSFGTSNFALRAPSMIAVGVACAGVVVLGRKFGGRRLAICSGLVFLLLPRVTWMGMEARSQALTAVVAVWLTILLLRALERRTAGWWVFYAGLAGLGVLLNLYVALLVVAHGVSLVVARKRLANPRRLFVAWGLSAVVAALLSFPIDRLSLTQTGQLPFGPLTFTGTLNTLLFEQYFSGATPTVGRGVPVPPTSVWAVAVILAAILGWLLIVAPVIWRRFRPIPSRAAPLGALAILVPWVVVPTALVIAYSLVVHPMYSGRYFAFTTPAVALLMGATISRLRVPWMRVTTIAALAVLVLPVYLSQRGPTSKNGTDWEQAAAIIQARALPGQDIYYGPARDGSSVSMHKISQAYPAVLSSLHDISLKQSPVQAGLLWGTDWPLTHARSVLRSTPILWAVMEHPGIPSSASTKQERYIERQGLHLVHIWRGSETDVLEFSR